MKLWELEPEKGMKIKDDRISRIWEWKTGSNNWFTSDGISLKDFFTWQGLLEIEVEIIEEEKKPTPYYIWRLWLCNGDIIETAYYLSKAGVYGDGKTKSSPWHEAVKREKISEAVYKIEGQQ